MRHFKLLTSDFDPAPLLAKLSALPHLWNEITIRQDYPGSAHHATESIYLRGPAEWSPAGVQEQLDSPVYPAMDVLFEESSGLVSPLLQWLGVREVGRIMIVRLKPGGAIDEHVDEGAYAEHFSRFHMVLQADKENFFHCGGEVVSMAPGEAWWFDHRTLHSVRNESATDRIHLIVDAVAQRLPTPAPTPLRNGIVAITVADGEQLASQLLEEHYDEIARNKRVMVLKPDWPRYYAMEAQGHLFTLGLFVDGELVGYSANFFNTHLHYADLVYVHNDVLFLRKEHRASRLGLQLIRATEQEAKARGARMVSWHAKENTALAALLPQLGYGVQDILFSKEI